jgi:hypothetical protein
MDNKVFQLAEKIKQDGLGLTQDYKNGQIDKDFVQACLIDMSTILEMMEDVWDVNLDDYYVGWLDL